MVAREMAGRQVVVLRRSSSVNRTIVKSALLARYGEPSREAVFDVLGDDVEVLKWERSSSRAMYVTVGGSDVNAVPGGESANHHGTELLLRLSPPVDDVARALAVAATYPLRSNSPLAPGATITLSDPLWPRAPFRSLLFSSGEELIVYGAWHVVLLTAVPVTDAELALHRLKGLSALEEGWAAIGAGPENPFRPTLA